jgi:hypothetical protein
MQAVGRKFSGARSTDEALRRVYQFADLSDYSFSERLKIRAVGSQALENTAERRAGHLLSLMLMVFFGAHAGCRQKI